MLLNTHIVQTHSNTGSKHIKTHDNNEMSLTSKKSKLKLILAKTLTLTTPQLVPFLSSSSSVYIVWFKRCRCWCDVNESESCYTWRLTFSTTNIYDVLFTRRVHSLSLHIADYIVPTRTKFGVSFLYS